jgi:flavin-dependent dehydrogenase
MADESKPIVIVIGGGPAGLFTAIELARYSLRAVVVERSAYNDVRVGEHVPPTTAMRLASLCSKMGVDLSVHNVSSGIDAYWGSSDANHLDYSIFPGAQGLNLRRPLFDAEVAKACELSGIAIWRSSTLSRAQLVESTWHISVRTKDGTRRLVASFVVDATGRSAFFARKQRARIATFDDQIAIITLIRRPCDWLHNRSHVESSEEGWWYCAPSDDKTCICMFFTNRKGLRQNDQKSVGNYFTDQHRKTKRLYAITKECVPCDKFYARSARSQELIPSYGAHWMAVGDSAMALDPLSSRGISQALEHGTKAAWAIARHISGDASAIKARSDELRDQYAEYVEKRKMYYNLEQRWIHSSFWSDRMLK